MTRKSALYLIFIFFACGIIGELSFRLEWNNSYAKSMYQYGFGLAEITSIILLLAYGTFLQRKWFKIPIALCMALFAVAAWFKILHLKPADLMVIISTATITLIYSTHFVLKKQKKISDYLKWILLAGRMTLATFIFLHIMPVKNRDTWLTLNHFYIYVVLGVYLWEEWKYNKLKEEKD